MKIITSDDGIYWASQNSGVSDDFNDVTFGHSVLIVVGNEGTIIRSMNRAEWTEIDKDMGNHTMRVIFGNNLFGLRLKE